MPPISESVIQHLQAKYGGLYHFAKDVTQSNLAEERTPQKLIRLTNKLERLAEREISGIHEQVAAMGEQGKAIMPVCKAGCWHCCTNMVAVSVPEVLNLADHIRETWGEADISALRARITAHKAITKPARDGTAPYPPRPMCPLLKEGSCSVWTHRPFVCRGWNSINVDTCIQKREHPEADIQGEGLGSQMAVTDFIRQGMTEGLEAEKANGELCELAFGLEIALDNPDAAERYLSGEDLFQPSRQGIEKWS